MAKIPKSKRFAQRVWSLGIGIYNLFGIWCLEFVYLVTKYQNMAQKLYVQY